MPDTEDGEVRQFAILFQKIFGSERYTRFMWEMRDEGHSGAKTSTGEYPIKTLRSANPDDNVTSLQDKRVANERKRPTA